MLFLSKIKHDSKWMEWWRWKLDMPNLVVKDSVGASGGLALFWKKDVNLTVKSLSKYHIDAVVRERMALNGDLQECMGNPKVRRRIELGSRCASYIGN